MDQGSARHRIEAAKESAVSGMDYFLRNFAHVPDDKLLWTPTPTAKSALRIAAHTALYAGRFAKMIADRRLPAVESLDSWLAERNAEEEAITDRVSMESVFRAGTEEVLMALSGLTDSDLDLVLDSGQGWTISMSRVIQFPGWHATVHAGQIDFLQTCWGDQEIYVG